MRIAAACLLPCFLFGGLFAYERFLASLPKQALSVAPEPMALGKFRWEFTASCPLAADAFAWEDRTLEIRSAGRSILARSEPLPAGETLTVTAGEFVPQIGRNAVFVRAVPAAGAIGKPAAARVRVYRDETLLAEQTIWSEPGDVIAGELMFVIAEEEKPSHSPEEHRS